MFRSKLQSVFSYIAITIYACVLNYWKIGCYIGPVSSTSTRNCQFYKNLHVDFSLLYGRQDEQVLCCNWLPECVRWGYLVRWWLLAVFRKKIISLLFIFIPIFFLFFNYLFVPHNNHLLTKLVRSRRMDFKPCSLFFIMALADSSVHKHSKQELGQHPVILARLVN